MAQFSGAIKIADLNDFIAPSQACVVSLSGGKLKVDASEKDDGEVQIQRLTKQPAGGFGQTLPPAENGAVKVTLHDCLACSGCITSAETVLLQHQSTEEFTARLRDPNIKVVVSVAPQSRAALAAYYGLPPGETMRRLSGWLKSRGVVAVLDITTARDISLLETAAEFIERYKRSRQCSTSAPTASAADADDHMDVDVEVEDAVGPLPMLASACPGWVCYAEKTHGDLVLPHISSSKSPMAVMGALVKRHLAAALGHHASAVYHASIMPCYDKKLEASREDFLDPASSTAEVDSCLTTLEVVQLLEAERGGLKDVPEAAVDSLTGGADDGQLYGLAGGSGGYMEFVARAAARELLGRELPPGRLPTRSLRNADFQEFVIEDVAGHPALRLACAYGFRNIQTLVRQMRLKRCTYDYVEVMACPSGCLNGGGQMKAQGGQTTAQLLENLEALYHHQDVVQRHPLQNPTVQWLYQRWVGGGPLSPAARKLLHTQYHKREKTVTGTINDW